MRRAIIIAGLLFAFTLRCAAAEDQRTLRFYAGKLPPAVFDGPLKPAYENFSAGKYEETLQALDKIKAKTKRLPAPERLFLLQGVTQAVLGRNKEAAGSFQQALRYRGSNSDVYFFLGLTQSGLDDKTAAIQSLNDALWFNRFGVVGKDDVYLNLAILNKGVAAEKGAIQDSTTQSLNAALAQNPQSVQARLELADIAISKGNRPEALRLSREAVGLAPQDWRARITLAKALLASADRTLHKADITEAVKVTSEMASKGTLTEQEEVDLRPVQARALLAQGKIDEAARVVEDAKSRLPQEPSFQQLADQISLEKQSAGGEVRQ